MTDFEAELPKYEGFINMMCYKVYKGVGMEFEDVKQELYLKLWQGLEATKSFTEKDQIERCLTVIKFRATQIVNSELKKKNRRAIKDILYFNTLKSAEESFENLSVSKLLIEDIEKSIKKTNYYEVYSYLKKDYSRKLIADTLKKSETAINYQVVRMRKVLKKDIRLTKQVITQSV